MNVLGDGHIVRQAVRSHECAAPGVEDMAAFQIRGTLGPGDEWQCGTCAMIYTLDEDMTSWVPLRQGKLETVAAYTVNENVRGGAMQEMNLDEVEGSPEKDETPFEDSE